MYANKLLLTNNQPTFNTAWPLDRLIAIRILLHARTSDTYQKLQTTFIHALNYIYVIHSFIHTRSSPTHRCNLS